MTKQSDLLAWCVSTFGAQTALSPLERAARLVEEAIEVAQAAGLQRYQAMLTLHRVYDRPAGELRQEIGGCAFTLAALAEVAGLNVAHELQREYERVMSIDPEFFRAKHAAKVAAGTSQCNSLVDDVAAHAREPFAWSPGPSK